MRVKIRAGSKKIGDSFGKHVITGFGAAWDDRPNDDTACAYGMEPGKENYSPIKMQYAYCEIPVEVAS